MGIVASNLLKYGQPDMKKNTQILKTRPALSLGDLILAVSSCTKNTKETVAKPGRFASGKEFSYGKR